MRGSIAAVDGPVTGAVRPATREETRPIALAAVLLGFIALMVCYLRGYILLYGDAVAHLGIARRILDSRNPGLAQLGGVWAAVAAPVAATVCAEERVVAERTGRGVSLAVVLCGGCDRSLPTGTAHGEPAVVFGGGCVFLR